MVPIAIGGGSIRNCVRKRKNPENRAYMRPQGRKLALIPEWQKRRPDLGADFNPEWHSGTSVGTPDPRSKWDTDNRDQTECE